MSFFLGLTIGLAVGAFVAFLESRQHSNREG
jgi:hypothetical protein